MRRSRSVTSPFPGANAPVVVVGGTGPYGRAQITGMRAAGTNIAASVAPGRGGTDVDGIPTFDTVADAVKARGVHAAVIYTPAAGARDAIVECADAGIGFSVVAAEFVPIHDSLFALARARANGMWVVGPNSLGFAIPGKILLGSIPPEFTAPGPVALFGRSGTLTCTTARLLTAQGIGQSIVAHIGGDTLCGRNPHEYLEAICADPATEIVVFVGEIGGTKEYAMLDVVRALKKPVVAMVVGRHAPPGKRMGHAGALIEGARGTAVAKIEALRQAGAHIADDVLSIPRCVKELLHGSARRYA
jgi:succinyl-CoA synthetase alpha subunit